jgi:flagellar basal body-associated protein FliL
MIASLLFAFPAQATTLSDVLDGISSIRKPDILKTLSFKGDMRLDLSNDSASILPSEASVSTAWMAPDKWKVEWEIGGQPSTDMSGMTDITGGKSAHPAVDHVLWCRPDCLDVLYRSWTVEYQGTAFWEGDPAWQLLVRPTDLTSDTPPFNMYVRKDDYYPLRVSVEFPDGTKAVTDLTWLTVDGVVVPARFTTQFTPRVGPLRGFETTFYNHQINPDLSNVDFTRQEISMTSGGDESDDTQPIFEELYHGFDDLQIVTDIVDSTGTYDRLSFTFSLYVEDPAVKDLLNKKQDAIRSLAAQVMSGREWSGDAGLSRPGPKYQAGRDIQKAINDFLGTDKITDFYFLDFKPLKPGE